MALAMTSSVILSFSILLGIGAFVALMLYLAGKYQNKKMKEFSSSLGGQAAGSSFFSPYCRLDIDGKQGRVYLIPGSQYTPKSLRIMIMEPMDFSLMVYKENAVTKKLGKWGLLKDVKTGDPLFDDSFVVKAKDELRTAAYINEADRKHTITNIFEKGFTYLKFDSKSIHTDKVKYSRDDLHPETVWSVINELKKLVK